MAYRGTVTNDDYDFTATVPHGYTGWGGVAADAPFHGFTIFLDNTSRACIVFEVHLRVDAIDSLIHPKPAKFILLGQAKAWQTSYHAEDSERKSTNLKTVFTFARDGETYDGQITLVTSAEEPRAVQVYDKFVKSIHFGGS